MTPMLALYVVLGILGYEVVRYLVVRAVRSRLRRSAWDFVERHRVRIDPFKFGGRLLIRHELANDLEIEQAMLQAVRERGLTLEQARDLVQEWIDEMAPRFSLATYIKIGTRVAAAALKTAFNPVVDHENLHKVETGLPADAVRVYMINHRSNFDYILVSYALHQRIALSWAVGEWARVWPLETLFKAFGAFFIRRKFKDPLYHTCLRRYVQLITKRGVTQGFFPEGMLSRDGSFNEARVGLLDYILLVKKDPEFRKDIRLIPVGVQFDRVVEDEMLVAEKQGRERPPTVVEKLVSFLTLTFYRFPRAVTLNLLRIVLRRPFRQGYAAISFGEPVSIDAWLADHPGVLDLEKTARQAEVKRLAQSLMDRIAKVVPATPVPLVCRALLEGDGDPFAAPVARSDLVARLGALRKRLRADAVPVIGGSEFEGTAAARRKLEATTESGARRPELAQVEGELLETEEAETTLRLGVDVLRRRRILAAGDGHVRLEPLARPIYEYYARSLPTLPALGVPVKAPAGAA